MNNFQDNNDRMWSEFIKTLTSGNANNNSAQALPYLLKKAQAFRARGESFEQGFKVLQKIETTLGGASLANSAYEYSGVNADPHIQWSNPSQYSFGQRDDGSSIGFQSIFSDAQRLADEQQADIPGNQRNRPESYFQTKDEFGHPVMRVVYSNGVERDVKIGDGTIMYGQANVARTNTINPFYSGKSTVADGRAYNDFTHHSATEGLRNVIASPSQAFKNMAYGSSNAIGLGGQAQSVDLDQITPNFLKLKGGQAHSIPKNNPDGSSFHESFREEIARDANNRVPGHAFSFNTAGSSLLESVADYTRAALPNHYNRGTSNPYSTQSFAAKFDGLFGSANHFMTTAVAATKNMKHFRQHFGGRGASGRIRDNETGKMVPVMDSLATWEGSSSLRRGSVLKSAYVFARDPFAEGSGYVVGDRYSVSNTSVTYAGGNRPAFAPGSVFGKVNNLFSGQRLVDDRTSRAGMFDKGQSSKTTASIVSNVSYQQGDYFLNANDPRFNGNYRQFLEESQNHYNRHGRKGTYLQTTEHISPLGRAELKFDNSKTQAMQVSNEHFAPRAFSDIGHGDVGYITPVPDPGVRYTGFAISQFVQQSALNPEEHTESFRRQKMLEQFWDKTGLSYGQSQEQSGMVYVTGGGLFNRRTNVYTNEQGQSVVMHRGKEMPLDDYMAKRKGARLSFSTDATEFLADAAGDYVYKHAQDVTFKDVTASYREVGEYLLEYARQSLDRKSEDYAHMSDEEFTEALYAKAQEHYQEKYIGARVANVRQDRDNFSVKGTNDNKDIRNNYVALPQFDFNRSADDSILMYDLNAKAFIGHSGLNPVANGGTGRSKIGPEQLSVLKEYQPGYYEYLMRNHESGKFFNASLDAIRTQNGENKRESVNAKDLPFVAAMKEAMFEIDPEGVITFEKGTKKHQFTKYSKKVQQEIMALTMKNLGKMTDNAPIAFDGMDAVAMGGKTASSFMDKTDFHGAYGSSLFEILRNMHTGTKKYADEDGAEKLNNDIQFLFETQAKLTDTALVKNNAMTVNAPVFGGAAIGVQGLPDNMVVVRSGEAHRMLDALELSDDEKENYHKQLGKGGVAAVAAMFPQANRKGAVRPMTMVTDKWLARNMPEFAGYDIPEKSALTSTALAASLAKDYDSDQFAIHPVFSKEGLQAFGVGKEAFNNPGQETQSVIKKMLFGWNDYEDKIKAGYRSLMSSAKTAFDFSHSSQEGARSQIRMGKDFNAMVRAFGTVSQAHLKEAQNKYGYSKETLDAYEHAASLMGQTVYQLSLDKDASKDPNTLLLESMIFKGRLSDDMGSIELGKDVTSSTNPFPEGDRNVSHKETLMAMLRTHASHMGNLKKDSITAYAGSEARSAFNKDDPYKTGIIGHHARALLPASMMESDTSNLVEFLEQLNTGGAINELGDDEIISKFFGALGKEVNSDNLGKTAMNYLFKDQSILSAVVMGSANAQRKSRDYEPFDGRVMNENVTRSARAAKNMLKYANADFATMEGSEFDDITRSITSQDRLGQFNVLGRMREMFGKRKEAPADMVIVGEGGPEGILPDGTVIPNSELNKISPTRTAEQLRQSPEVDSNVKFMKDGGNLNDAFDDNPFMGDWDPGEPPQVPPRKDLLDSNPAYQDIPFANESERSESWKDNNRSQQPIETTTRITPEQDRQYRQQAAAELNDYDNIQAEKNLLTSPHGSRGYDHEWSERMQDLGPDLNPQQLHNLVRAKSELDRTISESAKRTKDGGIIDQDYLRNAAMGSSNVTDALHRYRDTLPEDQRGDTFNAWYQSQLNARSKRRDNVDTRTNPNRFSMQDAMGGTVNVAEGSMVMNIIKASAMTDKDVVDLQAGLPALEQVVAAIDRGDTITPEMLQLARTAGGKVGSVVGSYNFQKGEFGGKVKFGSDKARAVLPELLEGDSGQRISEMIDKVVDFQGSAEGQRVYAQEAAQKLSDGKEILDPQAIAGVTKALSEFSGEMSKSRDVLDMTTSEQRKYNQQIEAFSKSAKKLEDTKQLLDSIGENNWTSEQRQMMDQLNNPQTKAFLQEWNDNKNRLLTDQYAIQTGKAFSSGMNEDQKEAALMEILTRRGASGKRARADWTSDELYEQGLNIGGMQVTDKGMLNALGAGMRGIGVAKSMMFTASMLRYNMGAPVGNAINAYMARDAAEGEYGIKSGRIGYDDFLESDYGKRRKLGIELGELQADIGGEFVRSFGGILGSDISRQDARSLGSLAVVGTSGLGVGMLASAINPMLGLGLGAATAGITAVHQANQLSGDSLAMSDYYIGLNEANQGGLLSQAAYKLAHLDQYGASLGQNEQEVQLSQQLAGTRDYVKNQMSMGRNFSQDELRDAYSSAYIDFNKRDYYASMDPNTEAQYDEMLNMSYSGFIDQAVVKGGKQVSDLSRMDFLEYIEPGLSGKSGLSDVELSSRIGYTMDMIGRYGDGYKKDLYGGIDSEAAIKQAIAKKMNTQYGVGSIPDRLNELTTAQTAEVEKAIGMDIVDRGKVFALDPQQSLQLAGSLEYYGKDFMQESDFLKAYGHLNMAGVDAMSVMKSAGNVLNMRPSPAQAGAEFAMGMDRIQFIAGADNPQMADAAIRNSDEIARAYNSIVEGSTVPQLTGESFLDKSMFGNVSESYTPGKFSDLFSNKQIDTLLSNAMKKYQESTSMDSVFAGLNRIFNEQQDSFVNQADFRGNIFSQQSQSFAQNMLSGLRANQPGLSNSDQHYLGERLGNALTAPEMQNEQTRSFLSRIQSGDKYALTQASQMGILGSNMNLVDMQTGESTYRRSINPMEFAYIRSQADKSAAVTQFSSADYDMFSGGTLGLQQQMTNISRNATRTSMGMQIASARLGMNIMMGGASGVNDQGFAVGPYDVAAATGRANFNGGNGMGMWQVQDAMEMLSREKQDWSMMRGGQNLDLQQRSFDMQMRQFYEKFDFNKDWFEYDTRIKRRDMKFGRKQQLAQQSWQAEDLSYNRSMAEMGQAWQMEDIDRNLRFSRGRDRIDMLRQKNRSTIQFSMESGQRDKQEERFEKQIEWADKEYKRKEKYFEKSVEHQKDQMAMEKRHFEERMKLEAEKMAMAKEDYEKEKKWLLEQRALEDQNRLLSRQQWQIQTEMSIAATGAALAAQEAMWELQDAMDLVETADSFRLQLEIMKLTFSDFIVNITERLQAIAQQKAQDNWNDYADDKWGSGTKPVMFGGFVPGYAIGGAVHQADFSGGGFTGYGKRDDFAGVVHGGEYVVPQNGTLILRGEDSEQTALLKRIASTLEDIKRMGPGRVNATINTTQRGVEVSDLLSAAYSNSVRN